MQKRIASASCVTALASADIAVDADLGSLRRSLDKTFQWNVTIRNVGGMATANARAEITLPPELTIEAAAVLGGTCVSGAGRIMCELGQIAGGNAAVINVSLRSAIARSNAITVDVSAANESNVNNNHGAGTISIQPEVDLAASLQAPASIEAGISFNAELAATNLSDKDAASVTLTIALPAGISASSAIFNGMNCTVEATNITCSLPWLPAGARVTGTAKLTGTDAGTHTLQARISSAQIDPVSANDTVERTVSITGSVMSTAQSASSGSGGGGAAGPSLLALLLGLLALKNPQPHPTRSQRRA
jgi:hypothetical protein